jgi:hypothetical protein
MGGITTNQQQMPKIIEPKIMNPAANNMNENK